MPLYSTALYIATVYRPTRHWYYWSGPRFVRLRIARSCIFNASCSKSILPLLWWQWESERWPNGVKHYHFQEKSWNCSVEFWTEFFNDAKTELGVFLTPSATQRLRYLNLWQVWTDFNISFAAEVLEPNLTHSLKYVAVLPWEIWIFNCRPIHLYWNYSIQKWHKDVY